jgi:hypothetical protein
MFNSLDTATSKKDGALIRPATDRAKGSDAPAFFTGEARLRLEEGLRDAGLRAALLVLGQSPSLREHPSQARPQSPPRQQSGSAQRPGEAFLTEEALLRLEEGLRAQRKHAGVRQPSQKLTPPVTLSRLLRMAEQEPLPGGAQGNRRSQTP